MRILILSKAMIVGTYQRKAEELAALPGVELTVAVPPSWKEPGVGVTPLERRHTAGYRLQVLPIRLNGHFHLHFYPGLRRLVELVRPDILHIDEESFNLATFQAMQIGMAAGARCCFYNYANIDRRYPPPFGWFERYNFQHATAAIAANHEAADILRRHGYEGALHILPQFGVDPELFHPRETPLPDQPFRIGYFGRLVESKGILDLLEAFARLPERAHLTLIGSGELEERIAATVERLGIVHRVERRPMVPSVEVAAEMRALHTFVLPSRTTPRWKEQFGRVLVEAMASGVPPIGSDSGEIPHVIGDGGLIFRERDVEDLAAKLRLLIEQPELRRRLAEHGRRRVLAHYTQRALAEAYYEVYREMWERRDGG
jgi:glycosyltransferase involved in cell wall biosynthesis